MAAWRHSGVVSDAVIAATRRNQRCAFALLGRSCCVAGGSRRGAATAAASTAASSSGGFRRLRSPPQDVAVLGGGLTGLTTAYYLAKVLPATSRITLYESSDRLGGWIDSKDVRVRADEADEASEVVDVVLEAGARAVAPQRNALRFEDLVLLDMVDDLNLVDALRVTGRSTSQFIYYPDHLVDMTMRGAFMGGGGGGSGRGSALWQFLRRLAIVARCLLTEPIFKGFVPSVYRFFIPSQQQRQERERQKRLQTGPSPPDESVGAFAARRMGGRRELVDNVLSAGMHGIYGGDVWRLSVGSTPLRPHWLNEVARPKRSGGVVSLSGSGIVSGDEAKQAAAAGGVTPADEADIGLFVDFAERAKLPGDRYGYYNDGSSPAPAPEAESEFEVADSSTRFARLAMASTHWRQLGFADGFATLTDALVQRLRQAPNVTLRLGEAVTRIEDDAEGKKVKVISTLTSQTLYRLTGAALPSLQHEHAVTIQLVNLYYAESGLNSPYHGFGYLIPQTVPLEQNPESALGVIFDTDREQMLRPVHPVEMQGDGPISIRLDRTLAEACGEAAAENAGSKFTVMMGGHYWDHYEAEDFPTPAQAVSMAESVLRRHLLARGSGSQGLPSPVATRTKLCRGCIPQHYVGHAERMGAAAVELAERFGGRLAVAGGSFTHCGPGVLPSVRAGRDVALQVAGVGYRRARTDAGWPAEQELDHVGATGLERFRQSVTERLVPVLRRSVPLRFGNRTELDPEARTWKLARPKVEADKQSLGPR